MRCRLFRLVVTPDSSTNASVAVLVRAWCASCQPSGTLDRSLGGAATDQPCCAVLIATLIATLIANAVSSNNSAVSVSHLPATRRIVKFSIFLPSGFAQEFARIPSPVTAYERLVEVAKLADHAGYETLFAPDHLTTIPPSHEKRF